MRDVLTKCPTSNAQQIMKYPYYIQYLTRGIFCMVLVLFCACRPEVKNEPVQRPTADTTVISDTAIIPARDSQVAFLSIYPTPEQHLAEADDDEASAWLWFHQEYPDAQYLYFGDISEHTLDSLRVLFWLRDVETGNTADVFSMPETVKHATPFIADWYRRGGDLILWGHAVVFIESIGRLPEGTYTAPEHDLVCACGKGNLDLNSWRMAVQLNLDGQVKKDHSTHPLFRGITVFTNNDTRLVAVKGPGWTEDHNCVFFNYPSELTGREWQQEICYTLLTEYYGIYPLATWDSQIWWVSQLNVYECKKGRTDFEGRVLCIGNGGCEFSMKSYRQTGRDEQGNPIYETIDDRSAYPSNNIYQDNILRMAANAIEYYKNY